MKSRYRVSSLVSLANTKSKTQAMERKLGFLCFLALGNHEPLCEFKAGYFV